MGALFFLGLLAAGAAMFGGSSNASSSSSSSSSTPRGRGRGHADASAAAAPPSSPSSSAPASSSAWARARGVDAPQGTSRSSSRSDASSIANMAADDAATSVIAAGQVAPNGTTRAQALIRTYLDSPSRSGTDVGRFVAVLQQRRQDSLAEYALDHWRAPAPAASSTSDGAATTAAQHALSDVRSGRPDLARSYLTQWVGEPGRATADVSSAAVQLQRGGSDDLADVVLDAWNERTSRSA